MPAHQNEVEIKFAVANLRELTRKLRAAKFRLVTPRTHELNRLYDFPDELLRQRGELLRIRKYGPKWTVTHKSKGKIGRHKSRRETETGVEDGARLAAIFSALGLQPFFAYEKFRAEWSAGPGHVVVDETPIGNFGEIEGPPRWIEKTARALGIGPEKYITSNYASLFQQWKMQTGNRAQNMIFREISGRRSAPSNHS
ncbi:MAG TPA: class IV adenylate cyclase [Terriglobales bacterium]|jgi:adenylate cyclase class 2|nr:class IV adenylate cyclase [Terriglobales bacterium]